MMRIIVTGGRKFPSFEAPKGTHWSGVHSALEREYNRWFPISPIDRFVVVHGGARGADAWASDWTRYQRYAVEEVHPADWAKYGRAAGPIRNQEMVDAGADACFAFPVIGSVGTYDCMRRARRAGIKTLVWDIEAGDFQ